VCRAAVKSKGFVSRLMMRRAATRASDLRVTWAEKEKSENDEEDSKKRQHGPNRAVRLPMLTKSRVGKRDNRAQGEVSKAKVQWSNIRGPSVDH
jgi:hypothetical protein